MLMAAAAAPLRHLQEVGGRGGSLKGVLLDDDDIYKYMYIYKERERERERNI
jgi:hypothetical protein